MAHLYRHSCSRSIKKFIIKKFDFLKNFWYNKSVKIRKKGLGIAYGKSIN